MYIVFFLNQVKNQIFYIVCPPLKYACSVLCLDQTTIALFTVPLTFNVAILACIQRTWKDINVTLTPNPDYCKQ